MSVIPFPEKPTAKVHPDTILEEAEVTLQLGKLLLNEGHCNKADRLCDAARIMREVAGELREGE